MILLALALLAAPQETGIMGFVYQATYKPPRTRAEAEAIMLNHEMTPKNLGAYTVTVRTTDGGVTHARFREGTATTPATLDLAFTGVCEPREQIIGNDDRAKRVGNEWRIKAEWGSYAYTFDDTPKHCITSFRMTVNP